MGDMAATIFGGEILSQLCARVEVKGLEHLDHIEGPVIFISNHQSFIDFAIVPFVLGVVSVDRQRDFRPKYMAARDHFYDNWSLYRLLGLGRAMEAVGTIFVDRKAKKDQPTRAVDEAVEAMIQKGSDILMFPQGTRAYGNIDEHGRRLDAGYYTTIREKDVEKELGHLRKGAAYLAIDAAFQLAKEGKKISIVPIGIKGAGIIAPRGKMRFERGVTVKVRFV